MCSAAERPLEDALIRNMLVLIVTTSIYRDYNIGGVRSTVFLSSIFLGLACLKSVKRLAEIEESKPRTDVTQDAPYAISSVVSLIHER